MWDQMYTPACIKTRFISIPNSKILDFKEDRNIQNKKIEGDVCVHQKEQ